MSKRILVTGATGFIGRQTITPLVERGYDVHAVYAKTRVKNMPGITWHESNLFEETSAEKLCEEIRPTHLLHYAWYVNPADYKTSPENERWVAATIRLLQAFQKKGGKRAVLAGTCMEYDWNTGAAFLPEDAPTASEVLYSRTKNETRIACEDFAKSADLSFAWGRIFNVFGPLEGDARLVSQVIAALAANKVPRIVSGVTLDYSYVKDTAGAFAALVDTEVQGIVNVASGKPVTLLDIARQIGEIMGKTDMIDNATFPAAPNPQRVVADITRLSQEVGWQPRYGLRAGLEESVAWWKSATANGTQSV